MRMWGGLALVLVLATNCVASVEGTGPTAASSSKGRILPAWKDPSVVKVPGKADQYSDYREKYPEYFAITQPPSKPGFRSFLEWEPMQGILLAAPYTITEQIDMVNAGADYVDFYVVVPDSGARSTFINALNNAGVPQSRKDKVHFLQTPADSVWMIDSGPLPLVAPDGSLAFTDFRYYHERVLDDAFPTWLGRTWGIDTYRAPLDFEGGNFQSDEVGTCYASQGVFWANGDKTEDQVFEVLQQYAGCRKLIVLEPLEDGTTHMDMFSKLCSKNVFLLGKATTAEATSASIQTLENDLAILQAAVLADGSKLAVKRIPMPYQKDGVWRTFTNSTFANGVNLVPVYSKHATREAEAMAAWADAMPDWTHVGIDSEDIIQSGGAMHCISRNVPAGSLVRWIPDGTCSNGTCTAPAGGYAGDCTDDADCFGPAWKCGTNDCSAQGCGEVNDVGCCAGSVLKYCDGSKLIVQDCQSQGCGWVSTWQGSYYDCGKTGSDPSGQNPKACPATCVPVCLSRQCGDDGCGGSCGGCPDGEACVEGSCTATAEPGDADVPVPQDVPATDDVPDLAVTDDLPAIPDLPDVPASPDLGGGDACVPFCGGRECGADGCGGLCGTCPDGGTCAPNGRCSSAPGDDLGGVDAAISSDGSTGESGTSGGGCAAGSSGSPAPVGWLLVLLVGGLTSRARRLIYNGARE